MKLCLLRQLKAAYEAGYRDDRWGLAGIDGRRAKVTSCGGDGQYVDGECFFVVEGSQTGGVIPLAPSLNDSTNAYCCQMFCDVSTGKYNSLKEMCSLCNYWMIKLTKLLCKTKLLIRVSIFHH